MDHRPAPATLVTSPSLSTPVRLGAFAVLLSVAFGAALGLGGLVDPTDGEARPEGHAGASHGSASGVVGRVGAAGAPHGDATPGAPDHGGGADAGRAVEGDDHGATGAAGHDAHAASAATSGLRTVEGGYRLVPARTRAAAGRAGTFRFRIEDPAGRPVRTGYELESERELHLIVVRRDGRGFQHLHPRRAADGTWSTPLTLPSGGSHRVLADFVVAGARRVLGIDLEVAGDYRPASPAVPSRQAEVDGLRVALALDGAPRAGRETTLRFRVRTAGGRPVSGLQPYLGARGHLVALREGDLSYLHVHPLSVRGAAEGPAVHEYEAASGDDHGDGTSAHVHEDGARHVHGADAAVAGPDGEVAFSAAFPAAGRHRLYLQFRIAGVVRTTPFVVDVAR